LALLRAAEPDSEQGRVEVNIFGKLADCLGFGSFEDNSSDPDCKHCSSVVFAADEGVD
jgi:hypothetical protein